MPKVNLGQYLLPDLVIDHEGKEYRTPPPSRKDGLLMASIVAVGTATFTAANSTCPVCGRTGEVEFDPTVKELLDGIKDDPLGWLTLGRGVVEQMTEDGIPEAHQDQYAIYALYYWTMGQDAAETNFEARYRQAHEDEAAAPKA